MVGQEIYFYHWRGKRSFVRGKVVLYDRIRKQHKVEQYEGENVAAIYKLHLEKETFFNVDLIPKDSYLHQYIDGLNGPLVSIPFKDKIYKVTNQLLLKRLGQRIYDFLKELSLKDKNNHDNLELVISKDDSQLRLCQDREAKTEIKNFSSNHQRVKSEYELKSLQPTKLQKEFHNIKLLAGPVFITNFQNCISEQLDTDQPSEQKVQMNSLVIDKKNEDAIMNPNENCAQNNLNKESQVFGKQEKDYEELKYGFINQEKEQYKAAADLSSERNKNQTEDQKALTFESQQIRDPQRESKIMNKSLMEVQDKEESKIQVANIIQWQPNQIQQLNVQVQQKQQTKNIQNIIMSTNCQHIVLEITQEVQQQIYNLQEIARTMPHDLVGSNVYIYWRDDKVWYKAEIIKYFESPKKFKVLYDDRQIERLDLSETQFIIEDDQIVSQMRRKRKGRPPTKAIESKTHGILKDIIKETEIPSLRVKRKYKQKKLSDILTFKSASSCSKVEISKDKKKKKKSLGMKVLGKRVKRRPQTDVYHQFKTQKQNDTITKRESNAQTLKDKEPSQIIKIQLDSQSQQQQNIESSPSFFEKERQEAAAAISNRILKAALSQPVINSKEAVKRQLLSMKEKQIDGIKIFYLDLENPPDTRMKEFPMFQTQRQPSIRPSDFKYNPENITPVQKGRPKGKSLTIKPLAAQNSEMKMTFSINKEKTEINVQPKSPTSILIPKREILNDEEMEEEKKETVVEDDNSLNGQTISEYSNNNLSHNNQRSIESGSLSQPIEQINTEQQNLKNTDYLDEAQESQSYHRFQPLSSPQEFIKLGLLSNNVTTFPLTVTKTSSTSISSNLSEAINKTPEKTKGDQKDNQTNKESNHSANMRQQQMIKTHTQIDIMSTINSKFFHFDRYFDDVITYFYQDHERQGYKKCTCESCDLLLHPILIRETRQPSEYKELHAHYLLSFQKRFKLQSLTQQTTQVNEGDGLVEENNNRDAEVNQRHRKSRIPNISVYFF